MRAADTLTSDTLFATHYTRDSLSRITQLVERVAGVSQTIGFTYDSVGRLSAVARNGVTTASYTYDLNGNRATKTTSGGVATATVDDQDRPTSYGGATYAYTNNGELRRTIVGTDTTLFTYDALVRAWLYQGQLTPVAELDGQGNVVSRFVYATGVNVPDYLVRNDSTYRLVRDHLGSVRLVVNVASGTVAQRLSYDEFGIETENTNPAWQPFGYAGGLTDAETGVVRFGARDYDPASGRWTAKDPIGFEGGALSLYEYAAGDPINAVDFSGRSPILMDVGLWIEVSRATYNFVAGAGTYVRGNYRSFRHLARTAGAFGQEEQARACLENLLLRQIFDEAARLYMNDPEFRNQVNVAVRDALLNNKARVSGRLAAGSVATFALTSYFGKPGAALGLSLALNAISGDIHYAIESGAANVPADLLRIGLLGGAAR